MTQKGPEVIWAHAGVVVRGLCSHFTVKGGVAGIGGGRAGGRGRWVKVGPDWTPGQVPPVAHPDPVWSFPMGLLEGGPVIPTMLLVKVAEIGLLNREGPGCGSNMGTWGLTFY